MKKKGSNRRSVRKRLRRFSKPVQKTDSRISKSIKGIEKGFLLIKERYQRYKITVRYGLIGLFLVIIYWLLFTVYSSKNISGRISLVGNTMMFSLVDDLSGYSPSCGCMASDTKYRGITFAAKDIVFHKIEKYEGDKAFTHTTELFSIVSPLQTRGPKPSAPFDATLYFLERTQPVALLGDISNILRDSIPYGFNLIKKKRIDDEYSFLIVTNNDLNIKLLDLPIASYIPAQGSVLVAAKKYDKFSNKNNKGELIEYGSFFPMLDLVGHKVAVYSDSIWFVSSGSKLFYNPVEKNILTILVLDVPYSARISLLPTDKIDEICYNFLNLDERAYQEWRKNLIIDLITPLEQRMGTYISLENILPDSEYKIMYDSLLKKGFMWYDFSKNQESTDQSLDPRIVDKYQEEINKSDNSTNNDGGIYDWKTHGQLYSFRYPALSPINGFSVYGELGTTLSLPNIEGDFQVGTKKTTLNTPTNIEIKDLENFNNFEPSFVFPFSTNINNSIRFKAEGNLFIEKNKFGKSLFEESWVINLSVFLTVISSLVSIYPFITWIASKTR